MDNDGINLLGNTISYLYKISEALPSNLPIPKSYYASKSRILELKADSVLPTKLTRDGVRCPCCCLKFNDYPPNVRLTTKPKQDRFTRKMLEKIEKNEPLTTFQEKFKRKLLKKSPNNKLINKCQFCKREIKKDIKFKINKIRKKVDENIQVVSTKKKRKRKDKCAGLLPSAIITLDDSKVEEAPVKKNVQQILADVSKRKEEDKINNVAATIDGNKKKKRARPKKVPSKEPVKQMKSKLQQKKEKKADQQRKNKIQNLLNGSGKQKASNVLNSFLQSL